MNTVVNAFARRGIGAWLGLLLLCLPSAALAQGRTLNIAPADPSEQRVALIIGNANYSDAQLKNPVNDAVDIARTLRDIGFQVTQVSNADKRQMRAAIRDFSQALRRGGVGLFYFAGHGIMSKGKNYLLPVKADIKEEFDLEDEAIDANTVLVGMEDARNRVNIVILDACRNNPFARSWRSGSSGGLAQMNAPAGSFIAFATSPNSVASDGTGRNGIFTKHLLENLRSGESAIDRVFIRVARGVSQETANKQVPWQSSSLTGIFHFRPGEQGAPAAAFQVDARERAIWDSVKDSSNPTDFDLYLNRYPSGYYAEAARTLKARLEGDLSLREEERRKAAAAAAEKARREEELRLSRLREEEEHRRVQEATRQEDEARRQRQQQISAQEAERKREAEQKGRASVFAPTF